MREIEAEVAPWARKTPEIDLSINEIDKNPNLCKIIYHEIIDKSPKSIAIYTDGSKMGNSTSSAVVIPTTKETLFQHLPTYASIFTAELTALKMALNYTINKTNKEYMIFADSLSSLMAI
ncbi:hypothetical protein HELRODRAFT_168950 [Helobdella robusta]|uniref:RNase H type-1 domain-containing protein n=1 Tax=Helobdella robusta TaxID=6412 RepID=T1F166_HELRO|nr:hypothetical protein HELRODRAFT_168950 [Helobdella robusta]ESO09018.1 hypothetical protein HELRODRAFT_168950 [Helobdella robusta]